MPSQFGIQEHPARLVSGGVAIWNITCYESGEMQPDGSHGN